jgi:predicted RNA-binding Zn ribbon-like protein
MADSTVEAPPGEDEWLPLALVNTRVTGSRGVFERLPDDAAVTSWLLGHGVAGGAGRHGIVSLRSDVRTVLEAVPAAGALPGKALARVNAAAADPVTPRLTADRTLRWEPVGPCSATALIAREAIRLAASDAAPRLRVCAADDCDRMFVQDHGRRIWCTPRCGTRMRVQRHLARRQDVAQ